MVYLPLKTRIKGIIVGVKSKYANHNPKPYNLSPLTNLHNYICICDYKARSLVQGLMDNKILKLHGRNNAGDTMVYHTIRDIQAIIWFDEQSKGYVVEL